MGSILWEIEILEMHLIALKSLLSKGWNDLFGDFFMSIFENNADLSIFAGAR